MTGKTESRVPLRRMGLFDLVAAGATFMAPAFSLAAIFPVIALTGGSFAYLGVFLGALAAILVALSFAEMSRHHLRAGGAYAIVGGEISPIAGFAAGWGLTILYLLGPAIPLLLAVSSLAILFPGLVGVLVPVTIAVALSVFVVNALGLKPSTRIAFLFFVAEAAILVLISAILFAHPAQPIPPVTGGLNILNAVGYSAIFTVFLFLGFESVTTFSEEAEVPSRDVAKGTVYAIAIAAVIYIVSALALTRAVPYANWGLGFTGGLSTVLGSNWDMPLAIVILTSSMGALIAVENTCARLFFAMGRDGMLPPQLSQLFGKGRAPVVTLGVSATVTAGFVVWSESTTGPLAAPVGLVLNLLPSMLTLGALVAYFLVSLSALLRMRREGLSRKALVPLGGVLVTGLLIGIQFDPASVLFSSSVLLGMVVWYGLGALLLLASYFLSSKGPEATQVGPTLGRVPD